MAPSTVRHCRPCSYQPAPTTARLESLHKCFHPHQSRRKNRGSQRCFGLGSSLPAEDKRVHRHWRSGPIQPRSQWSRPGTETSPLGGQEKSAEHRLVLPPEPALCRRHRSSLSHRWDLGKNQPQGPIRLRANRLGQLLLQWLQRRQRSEQQSKPNPKQLPIPHTAQRIFYRWHQSAGPQRRPSTGWETRPATLQPPCYFPSPSRATFQIRIRSEKFRGLLHQFFQAWNLTPRTVLSCAQHQLQLARYRRAKQLFFANSKKPRGRCYTLQQSRSRKIFSLLQTS